MDDSNLERRLVALLDRARQGDRSAYGEFLDLTITQTLSELRRFTQRDDVEELLAAVYASAWSALPGYDKGALAPTEWLQCIGHELAPGGAEGRAPPAPD